MKLVLMAPEHSFEPSRRPRVKHFYYRFSLGEKLRFRASLIYSRATEGEFVSLQLQLKTPCCEAYFRLYTEQLSCPICGETYAQPRGNSGYAIMYWHDGELYYETSIKAALKQWLEMLAVDPLRATFYASQAEEDFFDLFKTLIIKNKTLENTKAALAGWPLPEKI